MTVETETQLDALKHIGWIVAHTLKVMQKAAEPGMTTLELDAIGKRELDKYEAQSAPKITYNFPGYTCISINEEAAHGIPGSRRIQASDVVNIDVSAEKNGYFADTGGSFVIPPSSELKDRLLSSTRLALNSAANTATANAPLNRIGKAIQNVATQKGFRVIKNLCSHGVGSALHEEPSEIPGYYDRKDKRRLHKGLVITIEPFLSTKSRFVNETSDGWTLTGCPGNLSAQFEHTMVITNGRPILTTVA